jgi:hypothetical protein
MRGRLIQFRYIILLLVLVIRQGAAVASPRAECDGLPEAALTREAIASAYVTSPDNLGTADHIAACRKALEDKKAIANSPRLLTLLQAHLLSAIMAGHDLNADAYRINQTFLDVALEGSRAKLAPPSDLAVIRDLISHSIGAEGMTVAELDRLDHNRRMLMLLLLNRSGTPDQRAIDELLIKAADALSPFDLRGFRELAAIASMTTEISDADHRIYAAYSKLHPMGYLKKTEALYADRRYREAFDLVNAYSTPYFEHDPVSLENSSDDGMQPKAQKSDAEGEDFAGQMLRIKTTALAADIIVSLNPSTAEERLPWITRTAKYFDVMFDQVRKNDRKELSIWEQVPISEALIAAASPYNLLDAGSWSNREEWAKAQAALRKSQICDILERIICQSWSRSIIAAGLLKIEFIGKDVAYLTGVVSAMEGPSFHRQAYLRYFQGPDALVETMFESPIGKNDRSASLTGSVAGLDKGNDTGRAVAPLVYTVIVPKNGQNEAALLNRLWRTVGLVAKKYGKTEVILGSWFGSGERQDAVLRKVFSQSPKENPYSIARFALLNIAEQPESEINGVKSVAFSLAQIARLGAPDTEETALAETAVLEPD